MFNPNQKNGFQTVRAMYSWCTDLEKMDPKSEDSERWHDWQERIAEILWLLLKSHNSDLNRTKKDLLSAKATQTRCRMHLSLFIAAFEKLCKDIAFSTSVFFIATSLIPETI